MPRKNIRSFGGKPMIAWSIETALASNLFDSVVVSTDDDEIAAVAASFGAQVPFRRPSALSDDHAPTLPVIAHAIRWWEENKAPLHCCCCIYATAPLLKAEYLREGLELLERHPDAEFAFSVTTYEFPILRALRITKNGRLEMFWPDNETKRSQDLPEAWHDAGQFYWGKRDAFLGQNGIFSARSYPVLIPRHLVQDIDTPEDWHRMELMFAAGA